MRLIAWFARPRDIYTGEDMAFEEQRGDHWRRLTEERQAAIDEALSWMRNSEYVGGPSERDAWRKVLEVLGPFQTHHIAAPSTRKEESHG